MVVPICGGKMPKIAKNILIVALIAPFVFVLEAFVYGAPQTVVQNTENIRQTCQAGGGSKSFCGCVAEDFRTRLDVNAIAWRRIMFVRDTVPDKQELYADADSACRLKTN